MRGDYEEAHRQAEALVNTTTNPTARVLASGANGLIQLFRGRFGDVRRIVRAGRESAEKNGETPWMYIFGDAWLRLLCFDFDGVQRVCQINVRATRKSMPPGRGPFRGSRQAMQIFTRGTTPKPCSTSPKSAISRSRRGFSCTGDGECKRCLARSKRCYARETVANARREADGFLESARSVAEPNMRARAWEIRARVAKAANDFDEAVRCIEAALPILDKFEIPVAAWQVHRTAWQVFAGEGDRERLDQSRAPAIEVIMRLADSFEQGDPLIESFLTAPTIRRIFERGTSA